MIDFKWISAQSKHKVVVLIAGLLAVTFSIAGSVPPVLSGERGETGATHGKINLTPEHRKAVNRQRRIIFRHDIGNQKQIWTLGRFTPEHIDKVIELYMSCLDAEPNQIDSVWYDLISGDVAVWPSNVAQRTEHVLPQLWEADIDLFKRLIEETRKRGREVFCMYRVNAGDKNFFFSESLSKMKAEHPEWLIEQVRTPVWNFAIDGVRDYKLRVLRELAERYDWDGISIDMLRGGVLFPSGHQWENREHLTEFLRSVRLMLLEVEKERGRPFLLSVRVSDNLMGCHFDGLHVEKWAQENLVDMIVLGDRSSDVDLAAFRDITAGTAVKLYPSFDFHHSSDGYSLERQPGELHLKVARGVYANWWQQGADGAHAFNLFWARPGAGGSLFRQKGFFEPFWEFQQRLFQEIGSPETLRGKDKVFFVQRRGGGTSPDQIPNPENWRTPRYMYNLSNMFAPLPAPLANDGNADTLFTLKVADDVDAAQDSVKRITLRLLLSDASTSALPESDRLESVIIERNARPLDDPLRNLPPAKGIEKLIEVRLNNLLLSPAPIDEGWLVFAVHPRQLAVADNLVGIRVTRRPIGAAEEISVEKVELHVEYH